MAKIEAFNDNAESYDAWFSSYHRLYETELQVVRGFIPANAFGVEIGAGTGRFAQPLEISVGVEPSWSMASIAKRRGVSVVGGIAEELPFGNKAFDYVVMVTTVCFFDSVGAAFKEAKRVLKSGGRLIVAFINRESCLGQAYQRKKEQSRYYKDAKFLSNSEVQKNMGVAGFSNLQYQQIILNDPTELSKNIEVKNGGDVGGIVVVCGRSDGYL